MANKPTVSQLHKKLWTTFSLYIRLRDAAAWAEDYPEFNGDPQAHCVTCGRLYPVKSLQAGHFISRGYKQHLYNEKNVHSQCYGCNVAKSGNMDEYFVYMEKRYGREHVDDLMATKHQERHFTVPELLDMIEEYKTKLSQWHG